MNNGFIRSINLAYGIVIDDQEDLYDAGYDGTGHPYEWLEIQTAKHRSTDPMECLAVDIVGTRAIVYIRLSKARISTTEIESHGNRLYTIGQLYGDSDQIDDVLSSFGLDVDKLAQADAISWPNNLISY